MWGKNCVGVGEMLSISGGGMRTTIESHQGAAKRLAVELGVLSTATAEQVAATGTMTAQGSEMAAAASECLERCEGVTTELAAGLGEAAQLTAAWAAEQAAVVAAERNRWGATYTSFASTSVGQLSDG